METNQNDKHPEEASTGLVTTPSVKEKRSVKRRRYSIDHGSSMITASTSKNEAIGTPSSKTETRLLTKSNLWTLDILTKLVDHLQKNGFDGDYAGLCEEVLPNFSECTVKAFFTEFCNWYKSQAEDFSEEWMGLNKSNRRVLMNPSNIEQWILLVREVTDVQRLEWAPSLIPELIANFEEHPNPDDCVGVDYKAIYLYISTLMDGRIPKQLDPPSASKLYQMWDKLQTTINQSTSTSQILVSATVKAPDAKREDRDSKNRHLRDRRRTEWSAEEKEKARIVKSDDKDAIKQLYCENVGLNPFSFPPSM